MIPSVTLADGFRVITQIRIEHKYTYDKKEDQFIKTELGLRTETDFRELNAVWAVPRLRMGFGSWDIGPELRFPLAGSKDFRLLLKLNLRLDNLKILDD